ncbi:MAG: polymer-forming cytoskeletal protein [Acidobacteria bacterium]|nr:polymer-forming cytoskeletal protein [Acidobacteriota bacterium]
MWGNKKPEEVPLPVREREKPLVVSPPTLLPQPLEAAPIHTSKPLARIGRSVSIKGELAGSEELVIDGEFEGSIELADNSLTVGREGRVEANVRARDIVVEGTVRGQIHAADRLHVAKSANVMGDLVAARISIEDGAYFKGSIDVQKPEEQKAAAKPAPGESFRIAAVPVTAKDKLQ